MENIQKNFPECEFCRGKANFICYECYMYFCDSCYKLVHSKILNNKHKKEKNRLFCSNRNKMSRTSKSSYEFILSR